MNKLLKSIDLINEHVGLSTRWFIFVLIALGNVEVIQRYVFNHPTNWGPELLIMTGAAMYALSWGYVHKHEGHVRVDVLYSKLSLRGRRVTDIVCFLLFFLPSVGLLLHGAFLWMVHSWDIREVSTWTYLYPPLYPLRTLVFVGILLFALQGVRIFIRDLIGPRSESSD